ncbi:MAG: hypothetical protein KME29_31920 [Calothrix sp. FI2-JRJ7]|nr:hypothetical protein [Calothrix sp. FI2-JRJ7]
MLFDITDNYFNILIITYTNNTIFVVQYRQQAIASGMKLLDKAEIEQELAERWGGCQF